MSQQEIPSDFDAQYKRTLEVTGCTTQVELAAVLNIRQSSISDAKRRKHFPKTWVLDLFLKDGVNPQWLLCGTGEKFLTHTGSDKDVLFAVRVKEIVKPPKDCSTEVLVNELMRRAVLQWINERED